MPPPSLTTDRLILRPMRTGDADTLVNRIFGDPDIGWRYGLVSDTSSEELQHQAALEWIDDANAHWVPHRWGAWAICLRFDCLGEKDELVGFCGFFSADDPIPDHELAYGVAKPLWGNGIATEAVRACLRYIFVEIGIERVETVAHPTINLGSSRVLEKAGFHLLEQIDYLGSVEAGHGLFNHFGVDRQVWLASGKDMP